MIGRVRGWLQGSASEAGEVRAALASIGRRKQTIRLEVEQTFVRFDTRLALRRKAVMVAKPPSLGGELARGNYVRFRVPDRPQQEVRMEVATPHLTLSSQQPVFLCHPPAQFAPASRRKADRYDTSRFANLRLELPGHDGPFRILDLSALGMRIAVPYQRPRERLPAAQPIADAVIHMGRHVTVSLAMVTPRTFNGPTVGLSLCVDPNGDHHKLLHHLLRALEMQQRKLLRTEAF